MDYNFYKALPNFVEIERMILMIAEQNLEKLGITLPVPPTPVASYVTVKQSGNLVFVSGQGPIIGGKQLYAGKLGAECTQQDGYEAAKACAVNLLAQLKNYLGDLDKVKEVVQLKAYIASTPDFHDQPAVANGASDLMIQAFGEHGRHTRCALGTNVLPGNIPVEVELVVSVG